MNSCFVQRHIDYQENKDSVIAKGVCMSLLQENIQSGLVSNISFTDMPRFSHYDLRLDMLFSGKPVKMAIEIKERNKSKDFPTSEITEKKYYSVVESTKGFDYVYYMSLVNSEMAYLWDFKRIPEIGERFMWEIKKTQMDPESGYTCIPAYQLRWDASDYNVSLT